MILRGRVWKFGHDVDTDVIIPAKYLNTSDPMELAKHCMEGIDIEFPKKVGRGDIIVAGKNFGCGSSREHAPIAIKASGVSTIIAISFARIFYRNSFNMGLPIFECPALVEETQQSHLLEIDMERGEIKDLNLGKTFKAQPIPPFMMELITHGGLMKYVEGRKIVQNSSIPRRWDR